MALSIYPATPSRGAGPANFTPSAAKLTAGRPDSRPKPHPTLIPSERSMIQTLFGSVEQEPTLLEKLKSGVQKTRDGLVSRIEDVVSGRKTIDADLLEELEYTLISADIGVAHDGGDSRAHPRARGPQAGGRRRRTARSDPRVSARNSADERASAGIRGEAAGRGHGGRRERGGEDHHDRQTGRASERRRPQRAALRRRYVPRRGHRATGSLGRAHRHRGDPAEDRRRSQRGAVRRALRGQGARRSITSSSTRPAVCKRRRI